jgi:hypothetical protein
MRVVAKFPDHFLHPKEVFLLQRGQCRILSGSHNYSLSRGTIRLIVPQVIS